MEIIFWLRVHFKPLPFIQKVSSIFYKLLEMHMSQDFYLFLSCRQENGLWITMQFSSVQSLSHVQLCDSMDMPAYIRGHNLVLSKTHSEKVRSHMLGYFSIVEPIPKRIARDNFRKCQRLIQNERLKIVNGLPQRDAKICEWKKSGAER